MATIVGADACGGTGAAGPRDLGLVPITDLDPAPDIIEVNLIAMTGETRFIAGKPAQIWGYADGALADPRALVPGPLIEARQGDTVIVHFTNLLPEDTTIHWHGVRVPNAADGTHATQAHVPPGGTLD